MPKLTPLEDRVVIRQDAAKEKTDSGLHLAVESQRRPAQGTIIAVGPGKIADPTLKKILGLLVWIFKIWLGIRATGDTVPDEFLPASHSPMADLKPNDRVLFNPYAGTPITVDGEELLVIRVSDVITKTDE